MKFSISKAEKNVDIYIISMYLCVLYLIEMKQYGEKLTSGSTYIVTAQEYIPKLLYDSL